MTVSGVYEFSDYTAIVSWLESLELIEHANIESIRGDSVEFGLDAAADAAQLISIIELNDRLQPVESFAWRVSLPMAQLTPSEPIEVYRWPVAIALAAVICVALYLLQPILSPFVLGGLIAYLGDPLVDRLESRGVGRTLGVAVVFLLFSAIITLAIIFALPMLLHQLDALISKVPEIYRWLTQDALPWLQQRLAIPERRLPQVDWSGQLADNWQSVGKFTAQSLKRITGSGANLLLSLANLAPGASCPLFTSCVTGTCCWTKRWLLFHFPGNSVLPNWRARPTRWWVRFFADSFLVMCALGAIYSAGLWLVGLQLAMLLGLIAGLSSIVPYLGFMVGIVASLIAAYAQFNDWTMLLWVVLVFGVGQAVESMLLTPILVGDRIGLHPVAVIFCADGRRSGGRLCRGSAGFARGSSHHGFSCVMPCSTTALVSCTGAIEVAQSGQQLPLLVQLRDDATLKNFLPFPLSEALLQGVKSLLRWRRRFSCFLAR